VALKAVAHSIDTSVNPPLVAAPFTGETADRSGATATKEAAHQHPRGRQPDAGANAEHMRRFMMGDPREFGHPTSASL
jgi:hypothetical protein